jgi:hypothetical protein
MILPCTYKRIMYVFTISQFNLGAVLAVQYFCFSLLSIKTILELFV